VEGEYSRPQRPDQIRKGRPERPRKRAEQSTPNVYLVKIDSGKVTVPKI